MKTLELGFYIFVFLYFAMMCFCMTTKNIRSAVIFQFTPFCAAVTALVLFLFKMGWMFKLQ